MTDQKDDRPEAPHSRAGDDLASAEKARKKAAAADDGSPIPVVAIGASAGGLAALQEFFAAMPASPGIAFLVITHASSERESLLPELLARETDLEVRPCHDGDRLAPDRVLVVTSISVGIENGVVLLDQADTSTDGPPHPIDRAFRVLAADQGERAICIVLSGSGNDGALGIRAVKEAGGLVMAQKPETAQYAAMPENAIGTDLVDVVRPARELPGELVAYCRGSHALFDRRAVPPELPDATVQAILVRLRSHTGHDFTFYKKSTMTRRIERRMAVNHIEDPGEYLAYLRDNPRELELLLKELLISVTSFFRDHESWQALGDLIDAHLLSERDDGHIIRAWVPGCATGEEAYSLAILLDERIQDAGGMHDVQIFATDLDADAVEYARDGVYPTGIANDLSGERLQRYFAREEGVYRVHKKIRDAVVFAEQNAVSDPPFSRLDLIVCRNLLIYLNGDAQHRLLQLFHYGLRTGGLLFLGASETATGSEDFFETLDNRHKVMRRRETTRAATIPLGADTPRSGTENEPAAPPNLVAETGSRHLSRAVERLMLQRFAPCSAVVNERDLVVYLHGKSGRFFQPEQGEPRNNVVEMARDGLRLPLSRALRRARKEQRTVREPDLEVQTNGEKISVDLEVRPLNAPESLRGLLMLTLTPAGEDPAAPRRPGESEDAPESRPDSELERELQYTRESLQTTIEELETSNEELKSSNEELQSTNEELQSTNEELETSREEMQSLNEELNTVNGELRAKVDELSHSNDDMNNLLNSMQVAAIFLDDQLRVKRFTRQAQDVVRLIASDLGRPLTDLTSSLDYPDLIADCRDVLDSLIPVEREVQDHEGHHFLARLLPYRTSENVIDGIVFTVVNIDRTKQAEAGASRSAFYESIVQTVREPLVALDGELRVVLANRSFRRVFMTANEENGISLFALGGGQLDIDELRRLLEDVLPECKVMSDYRITYETTDGGRRTFLLNARRLARQDPDPDMVLLAFEEVSTSPS
jgi:two-component system CheB/CheR fusion protein